MKNYLLLFVLLLSVSAVKAQVHTPYADAPSMNYNVDYPGSITALPGVPMNYTDGGASGELTNTDITGTTVDVTWSIADSTLTYEVTVTAPSNVVLGLHRFSIGEDYDYLVDDDFENVDLPGYGTYWHSSGSVNLGNVQHDLDFSFENTDINSDNNDAATQEFRTQIHYLQPL